MTPKAWNLAVKDAFPTPLLRDEHEEVKCWPGPGLTTREWMATQILKGLVVTQSVLVDSVQGGEAILAEKAVELADALIELLANNEPEKDKEE